MVNFISWALARKIVIRMGHDRLRKSAKNTLLSGCLSFYLSVRCFRLNTTKKQTSKNHTSLPARISANLFSFRFVWLVATKTVSTFEVIPVIETNLLMISFAVCEGRIVSSDDSVICYHCRNASRFKPIYPSQKQR